MGRVVYKYVAATRLRAFAQPVRSAALLNGVICHHKDARRTCQYPER